MKLHLLAAALVSVAAAASAAAPRGEFSLREIRSFTHAYARCVVARRHLKASEALLSNVDNATLIREYPTLIVPDCVPKKPGHSLRMSFAGDLYRYALADALIDRELATLDVRDLSAVPRLDHRDPGPPPQPVGTNGKRLSKKKYEAAIKGHQVASNFFYLSHYGECVVRGAPAEAKALVLTVPDSVQEKSAFDSLQPALATCLPEGKTIKFGREALRGTIAINYYRLARAAAGSPPARNAG